MSPPDYPSAWLRTRSAASVSPGRVTVALPRPARPISVLHVTSPNANRAEHGSVRRLDEWLNSTILVEPPQIILERYQNIGERRREPADIADFSDQLKVKRQRDGLGIFCAAEQSGISPQEYYLAETGRPPPIHVRMKLEKWLHRSVAS